MILFLILVWQKESRFSWADGCTFNNGLVTSESSVTTITDCGNKCFISLRCTRFVWSSTSNTCYFYSGTVTKNDAIDSTIYKCGILDNQNKPGKN